MIFLTVGTSFTFDRLVQAIDMLVGEGKISNQIFAQVGKKGFVPKNFESVETLDKKKFDVYFQKADAVIAHAGMGTITMALELYKPLLVMPRLKKYRELVNDHQFVTAKRFEQLGHVVAAYHTNELEDKIIAVQSFKPKQRKSQAEDVSKRIGNYLTLYLNSKFDSTVMSG